MDPGQHLLRLGQRELPGVDLYCTVLYCTVLYQVWTCVNQNHTSLARGESVKLKCNESSKFRCIGFLSI